MPKLRALLGFHTRGRKGFGWERKHEVPEKENFLTKGNYYANFKRLRSRRVLPEIGRGRKAALLPTCADRSRTGFRAF